VNQVEGQGRATLAMVLASALWGATFVVIRDSLAVVSPVPLVHVRFAIATLALGLVAGFARARFTAPAVRAGVIGGACGACGFLFQAIGLEDIAAGSSAFLTCAGTLTAGILAWPLLGQRPSALLMSGLGIAGIGAALLPASGIHGLGPGEAWTLLGALLFAVQIVVIARDAQRADPIALTLVTTATIALVMAPFGGAAYVGLGGLAPLDWARFGYLALAGSALAPWLQVFAQRRLSAGRTGLLFALEPLFAVVFALSFGGERYGGTWWLGATLILGAVLLVEGRAGKAADR
jgi:drug/metabolite transporter (DMT)-like permease